MTDSNRDLPVVAISACLLGHHVRYDGGHRRNPVIIEQLGELLEWVPVCPEVEAGMGVPRPTIHLRRIHDQLRLTRSDDASLDFTEIMSALALQRARTLQDRISGFIFKKNSPSCGIDGVPIAGYDGRSTRYTGTGMFVYHFTRACPWIPVIDEQRLEDSGQRSGFFNRVSLLHRWNRLPRDDMTALREFHASHEHLLAGDPNVSDPRLERLMAKICQEGRTDLRVDYIRRLMRALEA